MKVKSTSKVVEEILYGLRNLSLEGRKVLLKDSDLDTIPNEDDINHWINIENAEKVTECIVQEAME